VVFAQVWSQVSSLRSPALALGPWDYSGWNDPFLAFKALSVCSVKSRQGARSGLPAACPKRVRLYLPRGVPGIAVGGVTGLVWAQTGIFQPSHQPRAEPLPRPHPMSCWLPACHAPRIAEGFAHVPPEQLHAGNWGLMASGRDTQEGWWGKLKEALV
jgi:hypothetical protein